MTQHALQRTSSGATPRSAPQPAAPAGRDALKVQLKQASYDEGVVMLKPASGGGGNGAALAKVDQVFNGFLAKINKALPEDERIRQALELTKKQLGGAMPPDYVPPQRRAPGASAAGASDAALDPNGQSVECEDGTMPIDPNVDGHHTTDASGQGVSEIASMDDNGRPISEIGPHEEGPVAGGGASAALEGADAPVGTTEAGVPVKGPWGFGLAFDSSGKTEASGKYSVPNLPKLSAPLVPGVFATLTPGLSGAFKGSVDAKGDWEFVFSAEASGIGGITIGIPDVLEVTGGLELKGAAEFGAKYVRSTGRWEPKPLTVALKGAVVLAGKAGPAEFKYSPSGDYELVVLSFAGGLSLSAGKDVQRLKDEILNVGKSDPGSGLVDAEKTRLRNGNAGAPIDTRRGGGPW